MSGMLDGVDSMAGLREIKFSAFIYSETPGWYIQVVRRGNRGSTLTQLKQSLQELQDRENPGKVCIQEEEGWD